jgi:hypothetical protein
MNKINHSKYKNTGILFELLVRQITADTLSGKDSKATNILKKFFVKTELGKEYKLYESLSKYKNLTEGKADIIINTLVETSKSLNRTSLRKLKYNLIKEISNVYDLNEFFKTKIPNYKAYASLYTLLEIYNTTTTVSDPSQIITNKVNILEFLTSKTINKQKVEDTLLTEFKSYDKDVRILTYKMLLEKFNGKYKSLNDKQKIILKEFINSVDSEPKLKTFYNSQVTDIKKDLLTLSKNVKNKTIEIKIHEVINLLNPLSKTHKVKNDDLVNLLQYCELVEEMKKLNG